MTFSFIDHGVRDFLRNEDGDCLYLEFSSFEEAEEFVMRGGLDEYGFTNEGLRYWCWEDQD